MKTFDTLYARNSNGKINEWSAKVENIVHVLHTTMGGPGDSAKIIISEGLIDGAKTLTEIVVKTGKNIGKMNETTPFQQACNEAQSRWDKKKKQGYKSLTDLGLGKEIRDLENQTHSTEYLFSILNHALPQNRTDENDLSKPMKAQPYFKDDNSVRISFPCFAQPKLNGFRVMARWETVEEGEGIFKEKVEKVVFRSKEGLRYPILEHIEAEFNKDMFLIETLFSVKDAKIVFDGEMYIPGEILSEISSAVRKRNSKTPLLKFYIFDLAVAGINQKQRIETLRVMNGAFFSTANHIKIVRTVEAHSNEIAQELTDGWIKEGYEGGIFRDMKANYQFGKRPQTMVKLKRFQDKEFRITDVVGGDNSPELGVFVCVAENGKTFKCTPEGTHEKKKEYLSNKSYYIGRTLTVRFFERTKDDLPFHAVGVAVRDYE